MIIKEIRIYAEVLEQGLDFKGYLEDILKKQNTQASIKNIYSKKCRSRIFSDSDSLVERLRKVKDIDVLISAINDKDKEYPLLIVEYSTAVPTDDHRMQRSDVYFWGALLKVPVLKISPKDKHMDMKFGGGSKLSIEHEEFVAFNSGGFLKSVEWEVDNRGALITKEARLSCISENSSIKNFLESIVSQFIGARNFSDIMFGLRSNVSKSAMTVDTIKSLFSNSSRFSYKESTGEMTIKINRFGHAMDPDRGVLYFWNQLISASKIITEFQMERTSVKEKGGYKSLFDGLANKNSLEEKAKNCLEKGSMSGREALQLFIDALNLSELVNSDLVSGDSYFIPDEIFEKYLTSNGYGNSCKFIFWLSHKIILTDKERNHLFTINWNSDIAQKCLLKCTIGLNYTPLIIEILKNNGLNEDLVTYSSVELYKKLKCRLLAVSYPGAQGDRCLLETEKGRNNKRIYIDIIAAKDSSIFLEEAKDEFSKSTKDIIKLINISGKDPEQFQWLKTFVDTYDPDLRVDFDVKISIGAKKPQTQIQLQQPVDYIVLFWIDDKATPINVRYEIFLCNLNLVDFFKPLSTDNKLLGCIQLPPIYVIS